MRTDSWKICLLLLTLAGCGDTGKSGSIETASLTGLYESGEGPRRNQLCIIEREGRSAGFGFIIWGREGRNCSASGLVAREGNRLRLRPDADDSCALDAEVTGQRVTFPANVPAECARYYCGEGAAMNGATFDKTGGGDDDAMRAADLVGDPLCAR